jgi:hypothetical protein
MCVLLEHIAIWPALRLFESTFSGCSSVIGAHLLYAQRNPVAVDSRSRDREAIALKQELSD